jgi:hypothetical protein
LCCYIEAIDGAADDPDEEVAASVAAFAKNTHEQFVGGVINRVDDVARGHQEKLEVRMRAAEKAAADEAAAEARKSHQQKVKEVKSRLMSHIQNHTTHDDPFAGEVGLCRLHQVDP